MSYLKTSICALLVVMTISSTAFAGNIAPRSGNIAPNRSGNIAPNRSGIIPTESGRFGFSLLIQLLLESRLLF